jgi:hypothetical protein
VRAARSEWSGLPSHDIDGKPGGYENGATISKGGSHIKCGAYGAPPFPIAWSGLCQYASGSRATICSQLHQKFFSPIAPGHMLSCKLESAFL